MNPTILLFCNPIALIFYYFCRKMRCLSFILALLIAVLTLVPCDDININNIENETSSLSIDLDHKNHHNEHHSDDCSPFCSCSCCQTHSVINSYSSIISTIVFARKQKFDLPDDTHDKSIVNSIWRPPQSV